MASLLLTALSDPEPARAADGTAPPRRGAAPPLLAWETGAPAQAAPAWRCIGFGPACSGGLPAPSIGLVWSDGTLSQAPASSARWTLLAGPADGEAPSDSPEAALAAAMARPGLCLLVDWQACRIRIMSGEAGTRPAFLLRDGGGLRLVEGVGALRQHAPAHAPDSLSVGHLLGLGHAPAGGAMLDGVWPILPGEMRSVTWDDQGRAAPGPLALAAAPRAAPGGLLERLANSLGPHVGGRVVGVVGTRPGPGTALLEQAAKSCGAGRVLRIGPDTRPASLSPLQTAMTALTGQPQADPALLTDAAAVLAASGCEVLLLDWGSEAVMPARPCYARFAEALARTDREALPLRNLAGGYLRAGRFARDLLFDELAVFSDEERYRLMGPALMGDGFFAMADEFGIGLETANPVEAAGLAARLDATLRPGGAALALRAALRGMTAARLLTPFLDITPATLPPAPAADLPVPGEDPQLRPADLAAERLGTILGPGAMMFTSGLLARTPPLLGLLAQGVGGSPRQRRQAFVLLALEKWLRVVGADA